MAQFLPSIPSQFRLTVGLRRIDPARWIDVDDRYATDLIEREQVLADHHDEVVRSLTTDGARSACGELGEALVAALPDAPDVWSRHPSGAVEVVPTGWRFDPSDAGDPLEAAAHLVADDLCVLDGETFVLLAGVVCFPNRWRLADKLGRTVTDIHEPVPRYREELGRQVGRVLAKLEPHVVLERRNWSILLDPALYQPDYAAALQEPVDTVPGGRREHAWVRVERQTLRRLPRSKAVVFGIRTLRRRLSQLDDDDRERLDRAVAQLPDDMAAYKRLSEPRRVGLEAW